MLLAFVLVLTYIGLVFIRPQEYVAELKDVPILPTLLVASALVWLPQPRKSFEAPQHWLLPLLVAAAAMSLLANGWAGGIVKVLAEFLPLAALFYLVSTTTDTPAKHGVLIRAMALFALVLAVHGIHQAGAGGGVGWSGSSLSEGSRITYIGIFNDPNDLALAFVMAMPMVAYALSQARSMLGKAFWATGLAVLLFGVFLTNSRGGMLAAGVQALAYVVARYGWVRAAVMGVPLVAVLAALPTRLEQLDAGEASAAGRVESWYEGLQMLLANPFFGVGRGNYIDHHPLTAHNSLVLAFAELGLVGYFFWFCFVALSVHMVLRISRTAVSDIPGAVAEDAPRWQPFRNIARTYVYSALGFLVGAFFLSRSFNVLLLILCALCVACYQSVRLHWPAFPPIGFRRSAVPLALLCLGSVAAMYALVKILL